LVVPSIGSMAHMKLPAKPGTHLSHELFAFKNAGAVVLDCTSPITTSPQMFIRSNMPRMASQAAASAASLSPRPSHRREFRAAASVARGKIQLYDSLDVLVISFGQSQSHGALIFTQVVRDDKSTVRGT